MWKRRFLLLLVLVVVGLLLYFFVFRKKPLISDHGILVLYGNVDIRQVNLGFQIPGRIIKMPYEEGDTVQLGQVIAQMDATPYQEALLLNQAQLAVQAANLKKLLVGTRVEQIAQLKANVDEQEANLANADRLLSKRQAVVGVGGVSKQEYEDSLNQKKAILARLQASQQALLEGLHGPVKEDIQIARENIKVSQASINQAKTQLSYAKLYAPTRGMIQTRVKEPGSFAGEGETVYTMAVFSPKWVQIYLEEPDLGRVKPGLKVDIFTDTQPNKPYKGQIGYISPVAEFTPKNVETRQLRTALVYPCRVIVKDPKNQLRQGMPVTTHIQTGVSRMVEKVQSDE